MNLFAALLAFALMAGFLGIVISYVPEVDLIIVCAIAILFTAIDFFRTIFSRK